MRLALRVDFSVPIMLDYHFSKGKWHTVTNLRKTLQQDFSMVVYP
jgi:hypothetical protein